MFTEEDAKWVLYTHSDALVVRVRIRSQNIYRVLVDNGSAVNVLTYEVYKKMGFVNKDLIPTVGHLYGFIGASVSVKGLIRLPVTLGDEPCIAIQVTDFMVVDQPSAYNAIVGRPILKEMRVVTSIYHLSMKFPTPQGVGCVRGIQFESRKCYNKALRSAKRRNKPVLDRWTWKRRIGFKKELRSLQQLVTTWVFRWSQSLVPL